MFLFLSDAQRETERGKGRQRGLKIISFHILLKRFVDRVVGGGEGRTRRESKVQIDKQAARVPLLSAATSCDYLHDICICFALSKDTYTGR